LERFLALVLRSDRTAFAPNIRFALVLENFSKLQVPQKWEHADFFSEQQFEQFELARPEIAELPGKTPETFFGMVWDVGSASEAQPFPKLADSEISPARSVASEYPPSKNCDVFLDRPARTFYFLAGDGVIRFSG
jgi:hypothetical protein